MKNFGTRIVLAAVALALAACSRPFGGSELPATQSAGALAPSPSLSFGVNPFFAPAGSIGHVCEGASRLPGHAHCNMVVEAGIHIPFSAKDRPDAANCLHHPGCYGPSDLQEAYNVVAAAASRGKGVKIAVIDAFGYPGIQTDLAAYRTFFKLPACGTGCFQVVNQEGQTAPLPKPNTDPSDDWRGEQALDIDMVSAMCPRCSIVIVQTKNDEFTNLEAGVNAAKKLGAVVISNSYAGTEYAASDPTYAASGVTITASAGDGGYGALQPCSFSTVICVGGTKLMPAANARKFSEVVWDGLVGNDCYGGPCATGSGCSAVVPKPSWQEISSTSGCTWRNESDISADADPASGVVIACTPCTGKASQPLLGGDGGTSASSPMVAAMIALAGNGRTFSGKALWAKGGTSAFNDVVKGTNANKSVTGLCPSAYTYICVARKGYDGPTGWGTPNGTSGL